MSCVLGVLATALCWPHEGLRAEDVLQKLRDDVRSAGDGVAGGCDHQPGRPRESDPPDSWWDLEMTGDLFGALITSPCWLPLTALGDQYSTVEYFPRFPYDGVPGYLTPNEPPLTKFWAGRFSAEYLESFDNLDRIGGRLLLSTSMRLGFDSQMDYFRERLPNGRHDQLWTGDCNMVFRFAQNDFAEFRAGLGFNWMSDSVRDEFGFNFTYGADFFPRRPWVVSTDLDWGTLGRAELFRFRTTLGITVRRFEFYTGYEYTDADRMHTNSLIGGVRVWF